MNRANKHRTDLHVRTLRTRQKQAERRFYAQADRQDLLAERIQRLREKVRGLQQEVRALQEEWEVGETVLGELGLALGDADAELQAACEGLMAETNTLAKPRTPHSRRGPLGIRSAILEAMRTNAQSTWSPQQVYSRLRQATTAHNVANTMRTMAADGEIERIGHGAYRLVPSNRHEITTTRRTPTKRRH